MNPLRLLLTGLLVTACSPGAKNPPADGFDSAGSDARAIEIADAVMRKMGGRENWDRTRYLTWRFFGQRLHVWDRWTGDVRFEEAGRVTLMNVHTRKGRVWNAGEEIAEADSLKKYLDRGYRAWINDSYWLVMPYKLKDSGVTLTYGGEATMENGRAAFVLTLIFRNVGVTPQNKYDVYVDKERMLVEQWAFYRTASDLDPQFVGPWTDWQPHGRILLSAGRGTRAHSDVAVFNDLPRAVFESPEPVDMMAFDKAR
ncbi:MAG: hypothetical protein J4F39_07620 [Candidatus Latescibacteria bacterium]|nr:hypothetical protein [Candidatus Latescibacterota bacterium]